MCRKIFRSGLILVIMGILTACGVSAQQNAETPDITENSSYESVAGNQINRSCGNRSRDNGERIRKGTIGI